MGTISYLGIEILEGFVERVVVVEIYFPFVAKETALDVGAGDKLVSKLHYGSGEVIAIALLYLDAADSLVFDVCQCHNKNW